MFLTRALSSRFLFGIVLLLAPAIQAANFSAADNPSNRIAAAILSADHATVQTVMVTTGKSSSPPSPTVIKDSAWLAQVAKIFSGTLLFETSHVLAISPSINFYDKSGAKVAEISLLPGNTVRSFGPPPGAHDYQLDKASFQQLSGLIRAKLTQG